MTLDQWDHYDAPRYYVDPLAGDDNAARPDLPWPPYKTLSFLTTDPAARATFAGKRAVIALSCGRDHYGTLRVFSGESEAAPFVVCSYGDGPRPRILPVNLSSNTFAASQSGSTRPYGLQDCHVSDVEFYFDFRDPDSGRFDLTSTGGAGSIVANGDGARYDRVTFDGCCWRYRGPTFQKFRTIDPASTGVVIKRSIVADVYGTTGHASGIFSDGFPLTIEDCCFLHNGHARDPRVAALSVERHGTLYGEATIYNHGAYLESERLKFRRNVVWCSASMGLKLRHDDATTEDSGLEVVDNLFVDNEFPLGAVGNTNGTPGRCRKPIIADNVSLDDGLSPHTRRGIAWPFLFNGLVDPTIASNVYARPARPAIAYRFPNADCEGGVFSGNVAVGANVTRLAEVKLKPDGRPMLAEGNELSGDSGRLPTLDVPALVAAWERQRIGEWDASVTAPALNARIRKALGVKPHVAAEPTPPITVEADVPAYKLTLPTVVYEVKGATVAGGDTIVAAPGETLTVQIKVSGEPKLEPVTEPTPTPSQGA